MNDVLFPFYCYRKVLMDVRCLPHCPFTLWAYNTEICRCNYRLGVFKLLLEDYVKLMNYEEYDVIEANTSFVGFIARSQTPTFYVRRIIICKTCF